MSPQVSGSSEPIVGHGHKVQAGHGQLPISSRLLELRRQRGNRCLLLLEDVMRGESRLLELGYALGIAQGLDELQRVLLNPDFYETQLQKPHNKLKKAQIPLRENKLSLELGAAGGREH